ncbi:hypothetical protein DACRYDRAFT_101179 [Dacryopinax primogenitus]|uniref:F-box domain-containing protein n=1 Tax=Dacryopinax primogenitus (strain DJM 731) TaxID=1858805 RepID=M5FTP1_DACPD|nr:uncharacterized protein DACRYDRAFT_101179 [Dacryopinax primogenitus]EJT99473.1 hypothetical protein DACRYDRAFT_101179 [Dacryopinax primogenitus]
MLQPMGHRPMHAVLLSTRSTTSALANWRLPLFKLPGELFWGICDLLINTDLLRLSETCRLMQHAVQAAILDRVERGVRVGAIAPLDAGLRLCELTNHEVRVHLWKATRAWTRGVKSPVGLASRLVATSIPLTGQRIEWQALSHGTLFVVQHGMLSLYDYKKGICRFEARLPLFDENAVNDTQHVSGGILRTDPRTPNSHRLLLEITSRRGRKPIERSLEFLSVLTRSTGAALSKAGQLHDNHGLVAFDGRLSCTTRWKGSVDLRVHDWNRNVSLQLQVSHHSRRPFPGKVLAAKFVQDYLIVLVDRYVCVYDQRDFLAAPRSMSLQTAPLKEVIELDHMLWAAAMWQSDVQTTFLQGLPSSQDEVCVGFLGRTQDTIRQFHLRIYHRESKEPACLRSLSFALIPRENRVSGLLVGRSGLDAFWIEDSKLVRALLPPRSNITPHLEEKLQTEFIWSPSEELTHARILAFDDVRVALVIGALQGRTLTLLSAPSSDAIVTVPYKCSESIPMVMDKRGQENRRTERKASLKALLDNMRRSQVVEECLGEDLEEKADENPEEHLPQGFLPWRCREHQWKEWPGGYAHILAEGLHIPGPFRPLAFKPTHTMMLQLTNGCYVTFSDVRDSSPHFLWQACTCTLNGSEWLAYVKNGGSKGIGPPCYCCAVNWDALVRDQAWMRDVVFAIHGLEEDGDDAVSMAVMRALRRLGVYGKISDA